MQGGSDFSSISATLMSTSTYSRARWVEGANDTSFEWLPRGSEFKLNSFSENTGIERCHVEHQLVLSGVSGGVLARRAESRAQDSD